MLNGFIYDLPKQNSKLHYDIEFVYPKDFYLLLVNKTGFELKYSDK